ncbi:MAG TPA: tetratricopeptide repeat protein [candidate division Zixibacteria bacterium]|nr:tetratricopeptide repeat protein [candidate division Zixibacteria bacterium]
MMKNKTHKTSILIYLAICIILLLLQMAAAQSSPDSTRKDDGIKVAVIPNQTSIEKLDWKAYDSYVNGMLAEQIRDYFNAARFYKDALQKYPESYEIRISLAECYFRMQKFADAIKTLEPIDPEDVDVFSLRGICYRSMGRNLEAKNAYLKVVEFDSLDQNAFTFLASEYRRLNKLDSLVWTYKHLVQIDSRSFRWWAELGQLLNQQGKSEEAKEAYRKSLEIQTGRENLLALVGMAESYRQLNQPESASFLYDQAVQLDPNNSYLNRELASHYADLDSTYKALEYALKLTQLEPSNLSAQRYLALLYIRADSILQAEELLKALVKAGDNEPGNFFYLGRIAIMKQDYESAREYMTILTTVADTIVDGWLDLGFVYRSQNDTAKSLNVYNSGLNFVNNLEDSVRLMFAIGSTLERTKRIKESSEMFEKILKLDPVHSPTLNYLGYMLADRGEKLEYAHDLIKKALELAPQNAAYIDSYGWVMYRLGKYDSAATYLEKAVNLETDPIIFDHLGDTYKAMGKTDDARAWWQKALELEPTNDSIREKLNE